MQQINLYRARYPVSTGANQEKKLVLVAVGILVSIVAVIFLGVSELSQLQSELAIAKKSEAVTTKNLAKLKKLSGSMKPQVLQEELAKLTAKLDQKKALFKIVSQQVQEKSNGLSKKFVALAKKDINGLWLTEIIFQRGGGLVTLRGETINPKKITHYLKRLGKESAFNGVSFTVFQIDEPSLETFDKKSVLNFVVSTDELPELEESILETVIQ